MTEKEIEELKAENKELKEIKKLLSDGEIGFIVELGDRAMKIQELQQQIKDKDQRISELEEERTQLIADNDFLKSERDNLDRTLQEAGDRIAELEEENEELKNNLIKECKEHQDFCKEAKTRVDGLQQENAKLQEQLKNAIVPKFKNGQKVWYVEENRFCNNEWQVFEGNITDIAIHISNRDNGKPFLYYKIISSFLYIPEKEIFSTEAEAQKYLEERK